MTHTSRPISFIHPATKESLIIPEVVTNSAGEILTHYQEKNEGWSPGGWYQDRDGKTFMVKFAYNSSLAALPYIEKMFNDMARACVGDIVPTVTEIGHGFFNGRSLPCYIASRVDGYKDISSSATPDKEEESSVELRKSYAKEHFHRFYSFCALIDNDDLN